MLLWLLLYVMFHWWTVWIKDKAAHFVQPDFDLHWTEKSTIVVTGAFRVKIVISLPDNKFLDCFKFKQIADNILKCI